MRRLFALLGVSGPLSALLFQNGNAIALQNGALLQKN